MYHCVRCDVELEDTGLVQFHEGRRLGVLGDLAELMVHKVCMRSYECPICGEISFFNASKRKLSNVEVKKGVVTKSEIIDEYGTIRKHPRFKEYMGSDSSRKHMSRSDQESGFIHWYNSLL